MKAPALRLVPTPPPTSADTLALARIANGDLSALADIYDRHSAALFRFATRAIGRDDAEDLVQTTFVTAARIAKSYDGRSDTARQWLHGIAARLIQERRRSIGRFTRALLRSSVGVVRSHRPTDDQRSDLERGLALLSPSKRVVLLLAEVEGYTCDEIAVMLEVPVGTIWTRLHHARKDMRAYYGEES